MPPFNRPLRIVFAVLLLAAAGRPAAAQDVPVAGRVDSVVGQAVVVRASNGVPQVLVMRAPVFQGDLLRTAHASRLRLRLSDGTVLVLGAETELKVSRFLYDENADERNVLVSLTQGFLRTVVQRLFPGSTMQVETRTAVASVRGTEWIEQAETEGARTHVVVLDGEVAVAGQGGLGAVRLGPGEGTTVEAGQPPTPPSRWGEARRNAFIAATSIP